MLDKNGMDDRAYIGSAHPKLFQYKSHNNFCNTQQIMFSYDFLFFILFIYSFIFKHDEINTNISSFCSTIYDVSKLFIRM